MRNVKFIWYFVSDQSKIGETETSKGMASKAFEESTNVINDARDSSQRVSAAYFQSSLDTGLDTKFTSMPATEHVRKVPLLPTVKVQSIQADYKTSLSLISIFRLPLFRLCRLCRANSNIAGDSKDIMSLVKPLMDQDKKRRKDQGEQIEENARATERLQELLKEKMMVEIASNNKKNHGNTEVQPNVEWTKVGILL